MPAKNADPGTVLVAAHVPCDMAANLRRRVESEDRTISSAIRVALRAYLNDNGHAANVADATAEGNDDAPYNTGV